VVYNVILCLKVEAYPAACWIPGLIPGKAFYLLTKHMNKKPDYTPIVIILLFLFGIDFLIILAFNML